MLGTNDCKTYYGNTEEDIAEGVEECLDLVLKYIAPEKILLVSPIQLGENVWKDEFVVIKLKEEDPLTIGYIVRANHELSDIGTTYIEELLKYIEPA